MRLSFAASALALMVSAFSAPAAPRDFAMGVSIGSPMGLSVMQNLGQTEAIQGALEYGVYGTFVMHADYLFKENRIFPFEERYGKLWLYYGPGARLELGDRDISPFGPYRHSDNVRAGLRFPAGLQYYIPKAPFDVFVEIAPLLSLWSATNVDLTMALGVRFDL